MAGQGQGDVGDGYGQGFEGEGFDGAGMDVAALADQFGSLSEGQEEMRQILAGLQEQLAQPQDEPGLPALDLDASDLEHAGGDPGDGFGDPVADAQELAGHLSAVMDAHTAPLREEIGDLRRTHEAAQLISEFPEMGEGDTIEQVARTTADFAHVLGRPELAGNFQLMRTVYLAGRALEMAQQEGDGEVPAAAHLERGGGAGPSGGRGRAAQAIVAAGRQSPLPFS